MHFLTMAGVGTAAIGGEMVSVLGSERMLLVDPLVDEGGDGTSATKRRCSRR